MIRGQFAAFVQEVGYKTDAEKEGRAYAWDGEEKEVKDPSWPNPLLVQDGWEKVEGASCLNPGFEQDDEDPVTEISWNAPDSRFSYFGFRVVLDFR